MISTRQRGREHRTRSASGSSDTVTIRVRLKRDEYARILRLENADRYTRREILLAGLEQSERR